MLNKIITKGKNHPLNTKYLNTEALLTLPNMYLLNIALWFSPFQTDKLYYWQRDTDFLTVWGLLWRSSKDAALPTQGTRDQSLVGKLRSHRPCSTARSFSKFFAKFGTGLTWPAITSLPLPLNQCVSVKERPLVAILHYNSFFLEKPSSPFETYTKLGTNFKLLLKVAIPFSLFHRFFSLHRVVLWSEGAVTCFPCLLLNFSGMTAS